MLKRFLKSEAGITLLGRLAGLIIRVIRHTTWWERRVDPETAALIANDTPILGVFWHNRLMMITAVWPKSKPMAMVQSEHGDSRIMGIAVADYVTRPIWGSTRKNPMAALKGMISAVRDGIGVGITPDGPRGPRMRCRPGVILVASRTGAPIVPGAWSVRRRQLANSWDRFVIAWPLNRGISLLGAPIHVPRALDETGIELWRTTVEDALNALTAEADRLCGHPPIEPAPMPPEGLR